MATGFKVWGDEMNAFPQGDADAWLAVWSTNDPVSVFGAVGARIDTDEPRWRSSCQR